MCLIALHIYKKLQRHLAAPKLSAVYKVIIIPLHNNAVKGTCGEVI